MNGPADYPLCNQTVTIYRYHGEQILRFVEHNCFFSYEDALSVEKSGAFHERKCLLIMPGQVQRIFLEDRVFDGEGPEICVDEWADFVPAKVAQLAQISYVKPCYFDGRLCHVEAGRK